MPLRHQPISVRHPVLALLDAACKSFNQMKQAHAQLITTGLSLHPFPPSKLLQRLLSLPNSASLLSYADLVFRHAPSPAIFTYNTLIKAHSSPSSLLLFRSLLRDSCALLPNQYTLAFVLAACRPEAGLGLAEGEQVRVHGIKRGLETNVFVSNVVIKMYASWGNVGDAQRVFDECATRDLFSWNSLIGGYVGSGNMERASGLFDEMPERDVVSWSTVISGYVQVDKVFIA